MSKVYVTDKSGEIDGKPIKWVVLSISGTISGVTQTLELKMNKTEAMLARILLASNEDLKVYPSTEHGDVNVSKKINVKSDDDDMDNFLQDLK